jgi:hypothetical protein
VPAAASRNVRSRRGRRHFPAVWRQLRAAGLDLLDLRPVADPRRLPDALGGPPTAAPI